MRYDGKVFRGLEIAGNLVYLNALFIISSLPLITIGPAWLAMMGVIREWSQDKEPPITSTFFKQFKGNFKIGLAVSVVQLIIFIVLAGDFFVLFHLVDKGKEFILSVFVILVVIVLSMFLYIYPLLLNYKMNIRDLVRNSFYLIFYKPFSVLGIILFLVSLVMLSTVLQFLPFLCMFSVFTYVHYKITKHSIQKVEKIII
ncbi:hypothetical protein CWR48_00340 [Oceanobacillus arenosus]|uniref:DUF624 domain-containing protein n=1 Tax=Oceanobacillus arenosus TaxID=1229153 RepID=A0A3D8Q299_9BACI|nr:DUF624 domain-containing protein [Oceanobacillus arenosus]RDW22192.1 hypothetical protein CWR48_00340 [Oceanobacillus arenosus]